VGDEITFRRDDDVAPGEYRALLVAVGWRPPDTDDAALQRALQATWNVTVRTAQGRLVGLARVLDDGVLYASVWDLLVEPARQRRGIGRLLMTQVLEHTAERRLVSLIATAAGEALYRALGFNASDGRSTALFLRHEAPVTMPDDPQA
jgi:ribosomal protein S18 acetylase RimI-like enzyme